MFGQARQGRQNSISWATSGDDLAKSMAIAGVCHALGGKKTCNAIFADIHRSAGKASIKCPIEQVPGGLGGYPGTLELKQSQAYLEVLARQGIVI